MLPPKALYPLIALKERLLQEPAESRAGAAPLPVSLSRMREENRKHAGMRHARVRSRAFQTACRRRDGWAPVF